MFALTQRSGSVLTLRHKDKKEKTTRWRSVIIVPFSILIIFLLILPIAKGKGPYTAEELGIKEISSMRDSDGDGIEDYSDIVMSARAYIATSPTYKSAYYDGGYPTDGCGVSTDVIWQALLGAGIDLKSAIDADIKENVEAYPNVKTPDPNIDFRRVNNLWVYFERNAISLTTDKSRVEEWQAGDIIVFEGHIGICSDKRNRKGVPYVIHLTSHGGFEDDHLFLYKVVGHYRVG